MRKRNFYLVLDFRQIIQNDNEKLMPTVRNVFVLEAAMGGKQINWVILCCFASSHHALRPRRQKKAKTRSTTNSERSEGKVVRRAHAKFKMSEEKSYFGCCQKVFSFFLPSLLSGTRRSGMEGDRKGSEAFKNIKCNSSLFVGWGMASICCIVMRRLWRTLREVDCGRLHEVFR